MRRKTMLPVLAVVVMFAAGSTVRAAQLSGYLSLPSLRSEIGIGERLNVGLMAASWQLRSGDGVSYDSKVRPLITADYRVSEKWSVGGWYNALGWDATVTGTVRTIQAEIDGSMYELHGTYALSPKYSLQAGYSRSVVKLKTGGRRVNSTDWNYASLWGLRTFALAPENRAALVVALGAEQGFDKGDNNLNGNALVGASWQLGHSLSADGSAWVSNITRSKIITTRFTGGVSARF